MVFFCSSTKLTFYLKKLTRNENKNKNKNETNFYFLFLTFLVFFVFIESQYCFVYFLLLLLFLLYCFVNCNKIKFSLLPLLFSIWMSKNEWMAIPNTHLDTQKLPFYIELIFRYLWYWIYFSQSSQHYLQWTVDWFEFGNW